MIEIEKEAEELFKKKPLGYEMKLELEIYTDGFNDGYNKANEWHYVKDGDLPKHEKDVQVLFQDCNTINSYTCLYDIHSESWLYYNLDNMLLEPFDYKVIAWKEIVLPEEIKNDR